MWVNLSRQSAVSVFRCRFPSGFTTIRSTVKTPAGLPFSTVRSSFSAADQLIKTLNLKTKNKTLNTQNHSRPAVFPVLLTNTLCLWYKKGVRATDPDTGCSGFYGMTGSNKSDRSANMKKTIVLFVSLLLMLGMIPAHAAGTVASGACGEHLTWTLNADGVLTVSGTGEMIKSNEWGTTYRKDIKEVIIEVNASSVAAHAFYDCPNLKKVTFPASLKEIGRYAFLQMRFP